jgi:hypothetical protein
MILWGVCFYSRIGLEEEENAAIKTSSLADQLKVTSSFGSRLAD